MEKLKAKRWQYQRSGMMAERARKGPRDSAIAAATGWLVSPLGAAHAHRWRAPRYPPARTRREPLPAPTPPARSNSGETLVQPTPPPPHSPESGGGVTPAKGPTEDGADSGSRATEPKPKEPAARPARPLRSAHPPLAAELVLRRGRRTAGPDPDLPARLRCYGLGPQGPASSPGSTGSRPPSAPTSTSPRPARRLDAVHALNVGTATGSTPTATACATHTTLKTRSSPRPATSARPACRPTPTARSTPTTTPTGTWQRCSPTPSATRRVGNAGSARSTGAEAQVLSCEPAPEWEADPGRLSRCLRGAAARYGLGRQGVWALAAVARLESNFGKGMRRNRAAHEGRWPRRQRVEDYAVDGDGDGHIRRFDPADSAATLARMIWSRGGLRAGSSPTTRPRGTCRRSSTSRPDRRPLQGRATVEWRWRCPRGIAPSTGKT